MATWDDRGLWLFFCGCGASAVVVVWELRCCVGERDCGGGCEVLVVVCRCGEVEHGRDVEDGFDLCGGVE